MYCEYFGLAAEPFGVSPDPRFFLPSEQHTEAAAALYYTISQRRGFAALIGQPGLGKTTVLVNLAQKLTGEARVAFLVHPRFGREAVLESVLLAMGLEPTPDPVARLRQLNAFLLELHRQGKTCVVMIDEAQNLSFEALETIRMLSNFEAPAQKLIQFVLAGQPGLARLLGTPECEQILQRISVIARLSPMTAKEVAEYIDYRLSIAGAQRRLFSPDAVKMIADVSRGVPRNVNLLCFNALTLTFAQGKKIVSRDSVSQIAGERSLAEICLASGTATAPPPDNSPAEEDVTLFVPSAHPPTRAAIAAAVTLGLICAGAFFLK